MTKRLVMNTYFDIDLNKQKIYPLIYQPFLEMRCRKAEALQ